MFLQTCNDKAWIPVTEPSNQNWPPYPGYDLQNEVNLVIEANEQDLSNLFLHFRELIATILKSETKSLKQSLWECLASSERSHRNSTQELIATKKPRDAKIFRKCLSKDKATSDREVEAIFDEVVKKASTEVRRLVSVRYVNRALQLSTAIIEELTEIKKSNYSCSSQGCLEVVRR